MFIAHHFIDDQVQWESCRGKIIQISKQIDGVVWSQKLEPIQEKNHVSMQQVAAQIPNLLNND